MYLNKYSIYFDENLNWSSHIDHLCSAPTSKISLLRQLSEYVSAEFQKMFCQGYSLPFIDYGSVTWGSAAGSHIERMSKLQKRVARIILHAEFNTPSEHTFKEIGRLSVSNRIHLIISSQSLSLGGHRGTTDDVATISFYSSLSSTAAHSLMLSSHLFFRLPLLLAPFTVSYRIVFARGARWLSGRVSDSGARGRRFETYRRRVVSLSKTLYSPKVLVNYPGSGGSVPT